MHYCVVYSSNSLVTLPLISNCSISMHVLLNYKSPDLIERRIQTCIVKHGKDAIDAIIDGKYAI